MTVTIRCPARLRGRATASAGVARYGRSVPLVAAAVCPHPPLIVPEIATGAAAETEQLRAACDAAVTRLLAAGPNTILVVGDAAATETWDGPAHGSLARFGAAVGFGDPDGSEITDLSLLIGGWLLARHDLGARPVGYAAVAADATAADCVRLGRNLAERAPRVALLAMGDGSACHGPEAPGYDDPRATTFHAGVSKALADADADALLALDPVLAAELCAAGRSPWQVLAGAAGPGWRGDLLHDDIPYGVGYLVATWTPW